MNEEPTTPQTHDDATAMPPVTPPADGTAAPASDMGTPATAPLPGAMPEPAATPDEDDEKPAGETTV